MFMPLNDYGIEYTNLKDLLSKQWQLMYQIRKQKLFHGFICNTPEYKPSN